MPELICAASDPAWRQHRRAGVTATDITAILGLSPYESPYSLWARKTGLIPDETPDSDRLRLGRDLEPVIVSRWAEELPYMAVDISGNWLYAGSTRPWQLATPDRTVRPGSITSGGWEPLEVKSWADAARHQWDDGPPPRVRAQVLWQMDTLDAARGHVGVLFLPSGEFRSYVIGHGDGCGPAHTQMLVPDCEICRDLYAMREVGLEFMQRVSLGPAPDPDGSDASLAALRAAWAPAPGTTAEVDELLWDEYANVLGIKDDVEAERKQLEAKIREQAGTATVLTVGGEPVARRVISRQQVKAHIREMDYLRRIPRKDTPGE